jgi:hypothetical protein
MIFIRTLRKSMCFRRKFYLLRMRCILDVLRCTQWEHDDRQELEEKNILIISYFLRIKAFNHTGKSWVWPKTGSLWFWINFGWALETDDSFWVARFQKKIGPVACLNSLVIDQPLLAWQLIRNSIFTFYVCGWTFGWVSVDAELIFANSISSRSCYKSSQKLKKALCDIFSS